MDTLVKKLIALDVPSVEAKHIVAFIQEQQTLYSPQSCWQNLSATFYTQSKLPFAKYSFAVQLLLYKTIYSTWHNLPAPAWIPSDDIIKNSNLSKLMQAKKCIDYNQLHRWSIEKYPEFWHSMVELLGIHFDKPYSQVVDLEKGVELPQWFPDGKLNIINSCFNAAPEAIAIISQTEQGQVTMTSYQELDQLSNKIANSIATLFKQGDSLAIIMPMTVEAVAIYLGIIKAGCTAVSIADSFSADEIAIRLKISQTKAVFTQDYFIREGKRIAVYERVQRANAPASIVLSELSNNPATEKTRLRTQDIHWQDFLSADTNFSAISCHPNAHINILFSSGTTGDPKAIPWSHTTPIKCASDAYLHHNLQPGDRFCWPTNLGWMMGPWLIFATLLNKASMALYEGIPSGIRFGKFIQDQKITQLGVVPTLVKTWRTSACMEQLDWSALKLFSSTGECSNEEDMLYLMSLAQYRPIIEYCGGTEIGGGYITGSVIQPSAPAAFTTSTLGLDFVILDEEGKLTDKGEGALIPPSIGLSTELLNRDHHQIYYQDMPSTSGLYLRRHGDEIERFANGFYRLHGRIDDTMNLSGIKISSAEIERILNTHPKVLETAAIAEEPEGGGPSHLIIYTVLKGSQEQSEDPYPFKVEFQTFIKQRLNPLFKIYDVVFINALPRTASNKVMRRVLREEYRKLAKKAHDPKKLQDKIPQNDV